MPLVASGLSKPAVPVALAFAPLDCMGYTQFESLIIGREPYDYRNRQQYVAQGGALWIYLNFTIDNPTGPFHQMLHAGRSNLGSNTGNSWGKAANLMDGQSLQRLEQVLTELDADFPEVRRIEADDAGPDNDAVYGNLPASVRAELYDAHVEHARLIWDWCEATGRIAVTNGLWRGDRGNGYPVRNRHGCDLYHVHFAESHGDEVGKPTSWWYQFMRDHQAGLKDAAGNNMGLWLPKSVSTAQAAAQLPFIAWTSAQTDYEQPSGAVTAVRDLGIPTGSTPPPPPPPPAPVKPARPAQPDVVLGAGFVTVPRPRLTDGATAWQAYVDSKNSPPSRLDLTAQSVQITHPAGETHTYRVGLSNGSVYSDWSDPAVTVTLTPPPPPPSTDPCAGVKAELAQAKLDLATRTEERNAAAAMALDLKARIDSAVPHIDAAIAALTQE
jgi:hypothetical protein